MLKTPTVTIINNEPTFRWNVSRLLERHGYATATHERNTAALDTVRRTRSIAVILEASSGSAVTATWLVERLRRGEETCTVPIVVCSSDDRFLHAYGEYLRGQGCVVIGRPYHDDQILEILQSVTIVGHPVPRVVGDDMMIAG